MHLIRTKHDSERYGGLVQRGCLQRDMEDAAACPLLTEPQRSGC